MNATPAPRAMPRLPRPATVCLALALLLGGSAPATADSGFPTPTSTLALAAPQGQHRLFASGTHAPYWILSKYFETQANQAYCSVASSVIALNALGVPRPMTDAYPDYPFFTQAAFFARVDPTTLDVDAVSRTGLTMEQLAAVLATYPVTVQRKYASDMTLAQFRATLREQLGANDRVVLLNFDRKQLQEQGNGHWSPLAAYHAASDTVLVLDVARYKYPPLWVPVSALYAGARSIDSGSGRSRGLVILEKK
jgi:hypothetical protein